MAMYWSSDRLLERSGSNAWRRAVQVAFEIKL
jgi:hypothetical protein